MEAARLVMEVDILSLRTTPMYGPSLGFFFSERGRAERTGCGEVTVLWCEKLRKKKLDLTWKFSFKMSTCHVLRI